MTQADAIETTQATASGIPAALETEADGDMPAVIERLALLPGGAIVTEAGLAGLFNRCTASVKAAIDRGELPRPVRVFGKPCWTAGSIIRHLESRLEHEAHKFAKLRA
jgi:hypothetical protein